MDDRNQVSLRRQLSLELGSYADRNDGFERDHFSRSKRLASRISKTNKPQRVKAPWKR